MTPRLRAVGGLPAKTPTSGRNPTIAVHQRFECVSVHGDHDPCIDAALPRYP